MKYISIFENNYTSVSGIFETVKILMLGQLSIKLFTTLKPEFIKEALTYEHAFVDIDLSKSRNVTGYQVIKELLDQGYSQDAITIITGHNSVAGELVNNNLPGNIRILNKPLALDEVLSLVS